METLVLGRGRPRSADLVGRIRDLEADAVARDREERLFAKAVAITNGHVLRMIEQGDEFTAHRRATQLGELADRRLRQLTSDPEGDAA